jgi:hypothetical protein
VPLGSRTGEDRYFWLEIGQLQFISPAILPVLALVPGLKLARVSFPDNFLLAVNSKSITRIGKSQFIGFSQANLQGVQLNIKHFL